MKKALIALTIGLFAALSACSTEEENVNNDPVDVVQASDVAGDVGEEPPPPECPSLPDLTGHAYRITSL
jgi:hypothetical protein